MFMDNKIDRAQPETRGGIVPLIVGVVIYSVVLCVSYLQKHKAAARISRALIYTFEPALRKYSYIEIARSFRAGGSVYECSSAETGEGVICRTGMDSYRLRRKGKKVVVWRWLARVQPERRWQELPRRMTETEALAWSRAKGRDIEKIEGTAEERNAN